jgi:hypothetical protein
MGRRISNIRSHRKIVEHIVSITPLLLSLQSPRPSSYQEIVTEDRVAQLCIREQKHERPWNIRDAARERASAGKDEVTLTLPAARPERRGAAAVPARADAAGPAELEEGPVHYLLPGRQDTACCLWPARSGSPRAVGGRGGHRHHWRLLRSAAETGLFPTPLLVIVCGLEG